MTGVQTCALPICPRYGDSKGRTGASASASRHPAQRASQLLLEPRIGPRRVEMAKRVVVRPAATERRQFRDGNRSARPEVAELANAIDDYKVAYRRRFITFEELYDVMASLGYHR